MPSSSRFPTVLFALLALIALLHLLDSEPTVNAQYWGIIDGSARGTILDNIVWGRKKRQISYVDGSASGTILSNLWGRKKRQFINSFADGFTSATILSIEQPLGPQKRQLSYVDGTTTRAF